MSTGNKVREKPKPLKISCTSADCDNGLHCFKKSREMAETDYGKCRSCGADLVDWERVHQGNLGDVGYVFEALKKELVRHHFWHKPIDQKAINHALRKGSRDLCQATYNRLAKTIAPLPNAWDGRQTSWEGNIIHYAQHATACCCRKCLEYWHGIPKDVELTSDQVSYFTKLIMLYINERMPALPEDGEKVPPISNKRRTN